MELNKRILNLSFKVCLFGDGGVGKTSLTRRYLTGLYESNLKMTIGTNFYKKVIKSEELEDNEISILIWDFGGEKQFRSVFPKYVKGAHGAIFMYDLTRFSSLNHIHEWMDVLKKGLSNDERNIPILIVGGKLDLIDKRTIDEKLIEEIVDQYNFYDHLECSSKTGFNVEFIFSKLIKGIMKKKGFI